MGQLRPSICCAVEIAELRNLPTDEGSSGRAEHESQPWVSKRHAMLFANANRALGPDRAQGGTEETNVESFLSVVFDILPRIFIRGSRSSSDRLQLPVYCGTLLGPSIDGSKRFGTCHLLMMQVSERS